MHWGKELPKIKDPIRADAKAEVKVEAKAERSGQSGYILGDFGVIFHEGRVVAGKD
jgi:hypothetical protein